MGNLPTVEVVDRNGGNRRVINEKDLPEWEGRGYSVRESGNPADSLSDSPPNVEDTHPNGKSPIDPPMKPPSDPNAGPLSEPLGGQGGEGDKWFAVEMEDGSTDVFPNEPPVNTSVRGVFSSQEAARASLAPANSNASGSD